MKSLGHGPASAAVDRDAAFTVEGVKLQESIAQALRWNREFDQVREVLFIREADHLGLATNVTSHLAQSTLSSVILKPTLSSAASESRSSIATRQASTGQAKPMPHLSDGKCRADVHVAANDGAQTAHIFWTSETGLAGHA
jgi:hypothetical protein